MPDSEKSPAFAIYISCLLFSKILFYASVIKGIAVAFGVLQMFIVGACKVVRATEVFLGTHVKIVVMNKVEHCVDASY